MKVICINNDDGLVNLTIGKEYDAENVSKYANSYLVKNDYGFVWIYLKKWFITLEEHRNKKLEELDI